MRVAQFLSKSEHRHHCSARRSISERFHWQTYVAKYDYIAHQDSILHDYNATETDSESFNGLGPKLDWNASTPVIGNDQNGEVTFDSGASLAVLFGRQKARGSYLSAVKSYYLTHWQAGFGAHPGLNALPGAEIPPARGHWINPGPVTQRMAAANARTTLRPRTSIPMRRRPTGVRAWLRCRIWAGSPGFR